MLYIYVNHLIIQIKILICLLKCLVEWQTVKTLIRLLLQEQSDLSLHFLHMAFCQKLWCLKSEDMFCTYVFMDNFCFLYLKVRVAELRDIKSGKIEHMFAVLC